MGDAESGGGGSVTWHYNVKNLKRHSVGKDSGRDVQDGADYSGREGIDSFSVSIAYPGTLAQFQNSVSMKAGRVEFDLLIQNDPTQIKIHWPD